MTNEQFIEYSPIIKKWLELNGPPMEYRRLPINKRCIILNIITNINRKVNNLIKPILNETNN